MPEKDVPGHSINSMDGLFKTLQRLISKKRILPMNVGKGNYTHLDDDGNVNKEHVYYKIRDMIMMIPQALRDAFSFDVLISKNDHRERNLFIKTILATDANYKEQEKANSFANFTCKPVPHWQDGLIIITLKKNAIQLYRDKADDNRCRVEKLKRNTHVHMDGAYGFMFPLTGKEFKTYEELKEANYEYQRIFTNAEFGAYTSEPLKADDTSPSVENHNVLLTAENTGATVITTFDDIEVGQKIYVIGGSSVNPSVIEESNANFTLAGSDLTFNKGVVAEFEVVAEDNITLISLYDDNYTDAIVLPADDATPDLSGGYTFITSNENSGGPGYQITDLLGVPVGKTITLIGGGGDTPTMIMNEGKFDKLPSTWAGTAGATITLKKRSFGDFVKVN